MFHTQEEVYRGVGQLYQGVETHHSQYSEKDTKTTKPINSMETNDIDETEGTQEKGVTT